MTGGQARCIFALGDESTARRPPLLVSLSLTSQPAPRPLSSGLRRRQCQGSNMSQIRAARSCYFCMD